MWADIIFLGQRVKQAVGSDWEANKVKAEVELLWNNWKSLEAPKKPDAESASAPASASAAAPVVSDKRAKVVSLLAAAIDHGEGNDGAACSNVQC